jgi:5-methylcytosine-specific restriction enzyme A
MRSRPLRLTARPTQRMGMGPPPMGTVDPYLNTPAHRKWAADVLKRADYRCEDPNHDPQYPRSGIRLHADHIVERRDGGSLTSMNNAMARCVRCHAQKTHRERARRMRE